MYSKRVHNLLLSFDIFLSLFFRNSNPPPLEKECQFIVKHNLTLKKVLLYTPNPNHCWGLPGGGIRRRSSRYIQKLIRNEARTPSILIQQVTSADAPISSIALEQIKRSMTTEDDYDYDPHEDDEEEDDMNVLAGSMGSLSVGNRTPHDVSYDESWQFPPWRWRWRSRQLTPWSWWQLIPWSRWCCPVSHSLPSLTFINFTVRCLTLQQPS